MTGGVAHDFNNLLTVVLGNATALRMNAENRDDQQAVRRAEMIERAAERGARLANQLLSYSRKQMLRPETISVYQAISAVHEMLGQAAGETARILLVSEPELWNCQVDPGQLESAILNLVINARDEMPVGGDISISCRNRLVNAETARARGRSAGDYVQTDVKDTGNGIPADLLEKVFEPFFTTKPIGKGSGLGLAQVQGFVSQSGGWVELKSAVGFGTTVSLFLPRARRVDPDAPSPTNDPVPAGNNRTILVVEPDPDLRTTVCEILSNSGYHALPTTNASGALAHLVSDEPIYLLLTEVELPGGVSGIDLAAEACRLRPGLHPLVTSGSANVADQKARASSRCFEILLKPYQASDLVRVVGGILKRETFSTETEQLLADARVTTSRLRFLESYPAGRGLPARIKAADPQPEVATVRSNAIRLGVMAFRTIGSSEASAFALGLAEEITRAFSPFRWITCVAPASIAALADAPFEQTSRWQQFNLDFLLEGSLRRKGDEIRVLARVVNMRGSGEMAWARRFDGRMPDLLSLQDQIASETAAQVAPELLVWEGQEAASRPKIDPTAYDLMLRAIPAIYRLDQAQFRAAGPLLESALTLDPSNPACHSWLAYWHLLMVGQGWEADPTQAVQRAGHLAQRAVVLDPTDARGFAVAGHVRAFLHKEAQAALWLHERAIQLNPNLALAWCYSGLAHSYMGQHTEAIQRIQRAQQISPRDPHGFFFDMALVMPFLLTGEYEAAARLGRRARAVHPGFSSTYKGLLAALGQLHATREATPLRDELLRLEPAFSLREAAARSPLLQQQDLRRYVEGLRLAGVPERSRMTS
ncbi:ATP-binding protein [Rhodopila sp.]|uniref:ATP-binding protein n=1 Tax=Rhodopila sp. TaxID=2480087 RepID=UPI003D0B13E1